MTLHNDLTSTQNDYALFLPALSTFYALFVGRQRRGLQIGEPYVDPTRIPAICNGMEGLNWLSKEGIWRYKWSLHSAGHASLDLVKDMYREDMYRDRDREYSWLLGDSGGFQIGKGKWEGDWNANSGCPKAQAKRDGVLRWMDKFMDYGMILDIPTWISREKESAEKTKITSYEKSVEGTRFNNEYFIKNRNGNCKFLNVLQGENFAQADDWYNHMKDFSNPKVYPDAHFNGWAMGGQNMCDLHLALKRVVTLIHDGLLEKGKQDLMHFLGTSKLEWAMVLTAIQRGVRKQCNENFTVTFDCASPFLSTSNGTQYTCFKLPHEGKWSYIMEPAPDDKALSIDTTPYDDYCKNLYENWMPSPLSQGMKLNDITVYNEQSINRMGHATTTSWDSFSYMLMMNHNVYTHIRSVQEANKTYDNGQYPYMLVDDNFDKTEVKDVISRIFEIDDKDKQLQLIDEHQRLWMKVVGTRGYTGKKTVNASSQFNSLFTEV